MSGNRFSAKTTKSGRVVTDRKTGAWYLVKDGRILDYGQKRETETFFSALPGRAVE